MIRRVTFEKSTWNDVPAKFEAGTPHIAGAIALPAAITDRFGVITTTGSMSLTAYLLHIVIVVGAFDYGVATMGWSVGEQELAFFGLVTLMVLSCVGFARWNRVGPAERIMKRIATPQR